MRTLLVSGVVALLVGLAKENAGHLAMFIVRVAARLCPRKNIGSFLRLPTDEEFPTPAMEFHRFHASEVTARPGRPLTQILWAITSVRSIPQLWWIHLQGQFAENFDLRWSTCELYEVANSALCEIADRLDAGHRDSPRLRKQALRSQLPGLRNPVAFVEWRIAIALWRHYGWEHLEMALDPVQVEGLREWVAINGNHVSS